MEMKWLSNMTRIAGKRYYLASPPSAAFARKICQTREAIIRGVDKTTFRVAGVSLVPSGTKEYTARHNFADILLMTEIKPESKSAYKLGMTPQTILIDASGKVEKIWTGLIRGEAQKEVEQLLGVKLPTNK